MALKDLSTARMVRISATWLDPARQRPALEKLARVAPLLEDLEEAHAGLLKFQTNAKATSAEIAKLGEEAAGLDAVHDRLARGLSYVLEGLAELTDDAELSAGFTAALHELMPNGLTITGRSYLDEAGEAELVDKRMSKPTKALLKQQEVLDLPLAKHVVRWQTAARELGKVEERRIALASAPAAPSITPSAARNAWIRVVNAMLSMLDLEKGLKADVRRQILDPVADALEKTTRPKRGGKADDAAEAEQPPADAAPAKPDAKKTEPVA